MKNNACYVCGKQPISKNEQALSQKLLDLKESHFYCYDCLANYLDVEVDELLAKIEDFKNAGCKLFS